MARLHLVRHGETTANVMRRLDTALPGAALTDFGVRQGVRFGLENSRTEPAILVNSVARRARQTAEMIGSVWDVDPITVDGIHEVQVGDLEDRTDREAHGVFAEVVDRWYEGDFDVALPGGESLAMVHDRYLPVIDDLVAQHLTGADQRDVYVVSHGAAIRLVAAHLTGIDRKFAATTHLRNTGSIELEYTEGGIWVCRRWGADTVLPGTETAGMVLSDAVDEPLSIDPATAHSVDEPMG